jgi:hypothetical protein
MIDPNRPPAAPQSPPPSPVAGPAAQQPRPPAPPPAPRPSGRVAARAGRAAPRRLVAWIGLATVLLYAPTLRSPILLGDDFQIVSQSLTWRRTVDGLWVPQNEHAMPPGRVLTYLLVRLAGRPENLPDVTAPVGPLALLPAVALVYLFVRRELGHPLYGLVAAALFGVSSTYQQAVWWFATSFSIISLLFVLLGLLAVQSWRRTGRGLYLDLAALWCLVAPAWFGSGILAGPLCCLYLLWPQRGGGAAPPGRLGHWSAVPLLGTALFLAVSLPRTAEAIMHLKHYDGKTALESFDPWVGLGYTARSLGDNLFLGVFGVGSTHLPLWLLGLLLPGLAALGVWWCRGASPRLPLLGLGLILANYGLIYSARAAWNYEKYMHLPNWSRYHLLPQLGLSLIVVTGLSRRAGRWFVPREGGLTAWQARGLVILTALLFLVQVPRAVLVQWAPGERKQQQPQLRRVGELDDRCRRHGISAETAREALPSLDILYEPEDYDGRELLRGSDDPRPVSVEEARRLLLEEDGS